MTVASSASQIWSSSSSAPSLAAFIFSWKAACFRFGE